jgi:excisionase family DNA binding protein
MQKEKQNMSNHDLPSDYPLLTKDDLAKFLRLRRRGVEELLRRRVIPAYRISRRCLRFRLSDVIAALARFEIKEVGRK